MSALREAVRIVQLERADVRTKEASLATEYFQAQNTKRQRYEAKRAEYLGEIDATVAVAGQVVGGMLFVVPIQFIRAEPLHIFQLSAGAWLAVALSGVIGLSASFVLLLRIIRNHGPTAAMLNLYVVPATAAALGVFALGETITPAMFVGAALVFGGVFLFTRS